MKSIELEDLKRIQLGILRNVATFCKKNGIRYYLSYGTLLGAVRHKGYIPWDDDIDIMMPRPDYERFISMFNGVYTDNKVVSHLLDPIYPWPFAKVVNTKTVVIESINYAYKDMGVYIDIFPIDGLPEAKFDLFVLLKTVRFLRILLSIKRGKKLNSRKCWQNFLLNFSFLLSPLTYSKLLKKLDSISSRCSYENSRNVMILSVAENENKEILPKSVYDKIIDIEFENYLFDIPYEYEKWLEHIYGDYMTLPPVEERITHHANNAYYKE